MELELDSEKRNHAETIKILRKKERTVKEIVIQCEEDQRNVLLLQEQLDKANSKLGQFKRQLSEQVIFTITRVYKKILINFNSIYYRRVSQLKHLHVHAESNVNWKLLKNVLRLQKVTWTWFVLSTVHLSQHHLFPEVKFTWSQKQLHNAVHQLKETKFENFNKSHFSSFNESSKRKRLTEEGIEKHIFLTNGKIY